MRVQLEMLAMFETDQMLTEQPDNEFITSSGILTQELLELRKIFRPGATTLKKELGDDKDELSITDIGKSCDCLLFPTLAPRRPAKIAKIMRPFAQHPDLFDPGTVEDQWASTIAAKFGRTK
ncbi:MAG: hypothetical protein QM780_17395 [Hyphomicrobium sp.]|uniref:hypothetical protein n=1 Tax=Hyphomicrobium sp. TaxID=82 RepID=UPI0039E3249C